MDKAKARDLKSIFDKCIKYGLLTNADADLISRVLIARLEKLEEEVNDG